MLLISSFPTHNLLYHKSGRTHNLTDDRYAPENHGKIMFFRKLSLSGSCDYKKPPAYNQNDDLNHLPVVLDQRISPGPKINPFNGGDNNSGGSSRPIISLKSLKRQNVNVSSSFLYNAFDESLNPTKKIHDSNTMRVELVLDNDTVYLPGLKEDLRSHTSLMDLNRYPGEEEELSNYKASLTGKLVITVKSTSLIVQDLKVRLNGYSREYICVLGSNKGQTQNDLTDSDDTEDDLFYVQKKKDRSVRLLKDNSSDNFSSFKPFVTDEISCFEKFPMVLTKGTYIIPFTFILDPFNYHSSFDSLVGATSYRIETLMTVLPPFNGTSSINNYCNTQLASKFSETIFLTHKFLITKTLSPSSLLKYESISSQGTYDEGFLDYDFFISSKLIELNCPFHCQFNFLTKMGAKVTKVTVSLVQLVLIPCLKSDGITPLKKSYIQTNTVHLGHYFPTPNDNESKLVTAKFEELVINTNSKTSSLMTKILPYYCEESRLRLSRRNSTEKRFKLKITHHLKITAGTSLEDCTNGTFPDKTRRININFKVPVMIIDKNMGSSLHLPAYEPAMDGKAMPVSIGSEFDQTNNSSLIYIPSTSSSCSPPSYNSLGF